MEGGVEIELLLEVQSDPNQLCLNPTVPPINTITLRSACFWQRPVQPFSGSPNPPRESQGHLEMVYHHPFSENVSKSEA